jgi:hypothetical protein
MTKTCDPGKAVARCIDEMVRAQLFSRALRELETAETYHGIDFIYLTHLALHDQMLAHVMKVLEKDNDVAGLWHLLKVTGTSISAVERRGLKATSKKLSFIRNKSHFHIDKEWVGHSQELWLNVGLTWSDLERAIGTSLRLLGAMYERLHGKTYSVPYYDAADARKIAEHAYKHNLLSKEPVNPALAALYDD